MTSLLYLLAPQPAPAAMLTPSDYAAAALALGCEVPAIRAVSEVETGPAGAFDAQGRPAVLFERHLFHRATGGDYDTTAPDLSNATAGGYGKPDAQYDRIRRALALDAAAALESTSWGAFQILGRYYRAAGFASVEAMVEGMRSGVAAHLAAFAAFLKTNTPALSALRAKDWDAFAHHYNGLGTTGDVYARKLAVFCKTAH